MILKEAIVNQLLPQARGIQGPSDSALVPGRVVNMKTFNILVGGFNPFEKS